MKGGEGKWGEGWDGDGKCETVGFGPGLCVWQGRCPCGGFGSWCPGPEPGATLTPTWTSTSTPTVTCPPGRTDIETSVSSHTQVSTTGPCGYPPEFPAPEAVAPPTSAQIATTPAVAPISRTRRPGGVPPPPPRGIRRICRRWGMAPLTSRVVRGGRNGLGPTGRDGLGRTSEKDRIRSQSRQEIHRARPEVIRHSQADGPPAGAGRPSSGQTIFEPSGYGPCSRVPRAQLRRCAISTFSSTPTASGTRMAAE